MKVKFLAREPGNHHTIHEAELDTLPRPDDFVVIEGKAEAPVHSVTWIIGPNPEVHVLLRTH